MAYELHIKRSSSITVEEWLKAVETTDGVKIDESDSVATNPITGEKICVPSLPHTVALWLPEQEEWFKVFWFRQGRISFKADDWDNTSSPVRDTAVKLAQKLNAEIIGDNGEKYSR